MGALADGGELADAFRPFGERECVDGGGVERGAVAVAAEFGDED